MSSFIKSLSISKHREGKLPNLIIIGATKCATTSLHYYLGLHPQILMSREKELDFFLRRANWNMGVEWYKSNFTGDGMIYGESSPRYTNYPFSIGVPERMYSVVPEAKLIYSLRDPIERIISDYVHYYTVGQEDRPIEEALSHLDSNPYVYRSKYFMQLKQYIDYFPKSNILIITLEDLYNHRQLTLQKIFRFLDVDDNFYSPKFLNIKHKSIEKGCKNRIGLILKWLSEASIAKIFSTDVRMNIGRVLYLPFSTKIERPVLGEKLRGKLVDYLREDINRLREYTGCDFGTWCV